MFADKIGGGEWFTVRQSTDGVAHVFIFGDVNFGTHWEKLLSDLSGADDIRLTVSSRGGDSLLGLAFFNAFNKGLVSETRIVGVAGSAAFTMALAGKKILIERNAKILRHAPCSFVYGEANELLCLSRSLRKVTAEIAQVLILRTEQPEEVVAGWLNGADFYFTPEQACAYGLADEIFDLPQPDAHGAPVANPATGKANEKPLPTFTEDELLFNDLLLAVGRIKVRSRPDFLRELLAWATYNTDEQPENL